MSIRNSTCYSFILSRLPNHILSRHSTKPCIVSTYGSSRRSSYSKSENYHSNHRLYISFGSLLGAGAATFVIYQWNRRGNLVDMKSRDELSHEILNPVRYQKSSERSNDKEKVLRLQRKDFRQNLKREIEMYRITNLIPGIICQVQIDEEVVFRNDFGYCDIEQLIPCDGSRATFRIASISKLITGLIAIKLASEGKIHLDDSIYIYLKDFPKKLVDGEAVDITIRQLLNHTSGVRHYIKKDSKLLTEEEKMAETARNSQRNDEFVSLKETIKAFKDDELLHKPGSIFLYTTYGFTLLSAVLETVMDKPFHEYILDFVRQMGLNHTLPEPTPKSREFVFNRMPCYLYDPKKERLTPVPEVTLMHKTAGGGMVSTLNDLSHLGVLFARTMTGEEMFLPGVKREIFDQIVRPPKGKEVSMTNRKHVKYSLGMSVHENDPSLPEGTVIVGHGGASTGLCSHLAVCAPRGDWSRPIIVTIAANLNNRNLKEITKQIIRETIALNDSLAK